MKNITICFLICYLFFSCKNETLTKKELPSNILSSVQMCEVYFDLGKKTDSTIINFTTKKIDELSIDSIQKLLNTTDRNSANYEKSLKELDEILKYNPEYSDYDEIKNMKTPYYKTDLKKYFENMDYLNSRFSYLLKNE